MASNQHYCLYLALLFLLISFTSSSSSSSSTFLSYDALTAGKSTGRSLLQTRKDCPVNMESQNYTILTSQCKGPNYIPSVCCKALLEFCCDFVDALNDMSNNCADTMFSYIHLYGQYPAGLFSNQCKEGKEGLSCEKILHYKNQKNQIKNSAVAPQSHFLLPALSSAAFLAYFLF